MRSPWQVWSIFALCLLLGLAAMGWVSVTVLRLEAAQIQAARDADREERVRLALWRMDSALAPLVAQEAARPAFAYAPFYSVDRAYNRNFAPIEVNEVLIPSPLLTGTSRYVRLNFQYDPQEDLTSPQVLTGDAMNQAKPSLGNSEQLRDNAGRLDRLRGIVDRPALLAALDDRQRPPSLVNTNLALNSAFLNTGRFPNDAGPEKQPVELAQNAPPAQPVPQPQQDYSQNLRNAAEYQARNKQRQQVEEQAQTLVKQSNSGNWLSQAPQQMASESPAVKSKPVPQKPAAESPISTEVKTGLMQPVWMSGELLLARRVTQRGTECVQGCWLDWPAIRTQLLSDVGDLLPSAALEPSASRHEEPGERRLAALPVRLVPGEVPAPAPPALSPIRLSLAAAWIGAALAVLAAAGLLWGVVRLSERRGAFVSAVTHELRTPLTTFCSYTEMLDEGMVTGEEKRRQYVSTLRAESVRLKHLVENVLAFARLERGRKGGRVQTLPMEAMLERFRDRLSQRAEQAGLTIERDGDAAAWARPVRADPAAVEQILFNLVDNACKYAACGEDKRIHLEARVGTRGVELAVRDHGPGIAAAEARRLFQPFSKSAADAANSAPGVGLGLALCRRLARDMGGNLTLDATVRYGACFVVRLPAG